MAQRCDWQGRVCDLSGHLGVCGLEEVECPYPGCEEWMTRAEVEEHVATSGAVHLQVVLSVVAEMGEKVAELHEKVGGQAEEIARLEGEMREQSLKPGERFLTQALTHVFTWSTDREWSPGKSTSYTFTGGLSGGLRGHCLNKINSAGSPVAPDCTHFAGFCLEEGPVCDINYR